MLVRGTTMVGPMITESPKRQRDPVLMKAYSLKHRVTTQYGLTMERYEEMLEEQDNKCAICRGVNANGHALQIDHDHSCCPGNASCGLCVRGLLCNKCNKALGLFNDNLNALERATKYLQEGIFCP